MSLIQTCSFSHKICFLYVLTFCKGFFSYNFYPYSILAAPYDLPKIWYAVKWKPIMVLLDQEPFAFT